MALYLGNTKIPGVVVGTDAVIEKLDTEITQQDDLIAQITAALEGKMVPSSGAETCTLKITRTSGLGGVYLRVIYLDENQEPSIYDNTDFMNGDSIEVTTLKKSFVYVKGCYIDLVTNVELVYADTGSIYYITGDVDTTIS